MRKNILNFFLLVILMLILLVPLSACEKEEDFQNMFVLPIDAEGLYVFEGHPDISDSQNGVFISTNKFENTSELFGKPIVSADDGIVVSVVTDYKAGQGYGKYLVISHDDGWETLYGHCSKINVEEGDEVRKGDVIAEVGGTGRTSHIGCYFEIRKDSLPVETSKFIDD